MRVRIAEAKDAAEIAAIYAYYVRETSITFETEPPSAKDIASRITNGLDTHPWLVALNGSDIVGYAYAGRFSSRAAYDWSAETTVYLHRDAHRQGIGKRLYTVLIGLLREQGYHSLYAGVTLPNDASVGLHRSIGMDEVGTYREAGFKAGQWHDVGWFGMTISTPEAPAMPPLPFPEFLSQRREAVELLIG